MTWLTLLVCLAIGCNNKPQVISGPHFRVLTYNVNFGGTNPAAATRAIAEADADVVCLQETTPQWEQEIRSAVGARYPHIHFRHGPAASGIALLSKYPVARLDLVRPQSGWFPACVATVQTPGGDVQFVGVHLHPPVSESGSFASGYFATKPIRRAEIEELHDAAGGLRGEPGMPTIVLGDFNESDSGRAVTYLRSRGYRDAVHEFDRYTTTWHWSVGPIPLRDRLDHIIYSSSLRCFDCKVMKVGESDHFPVIATFGAAQSDTGGDERKRNF